MTDSVDPLAIPDSTPAELRTPTRAADLETITARFRTLESLEMRYAEERVASGKVILATAGYRAPREQCLTLAEFADLQRRARRRGWR